MSISLRPADADELPALVRTCWRAFSEQAPDEVVEAYVAAIDPARTLVAFDGDRMVATLGAYSMDLTVPGGAQVPVAGLTLVGVLPTHRRRGLLRSMMGRHLDDVAARGELASVLLAAESAIYGRFGYGAATWLREWELETDHSELLAPVESVGSVEIVEHEEALDAFHRVFDAHRLRTVGELSRTVELAHAERTGLEHDLEGTWFSALHASDDGTPDGYVHYRVTDTDWPHGIARQRIDVRELVATSPSTRAALLRFVCDIDLVERVSVACGVLDEPFAWRLSDPRRLTTTAVGDHLWVRPVDVRRLLEARTYRHDGRLVLAVDGESCELVVEAGVGRCTPTDAPVDLELDVVALGSAYLGGVSFRTLLAAGRLAADEGAVDLADRLFLEPTPPYCLSTF